MLANVLAKQTSRLSPVANLILPQTCQQVRYVKHRHTFQYAFGLEPITTTDQYEEVAETGKLDDLQYEEIRPARIWETNSPFFDEIHDRYLRYMMHDGRRSLMTDILHKTLYEVKTIQFRRWKKLQQKQQQQQQQSTAKADSAKKLPSPSLADDLDEVELNPMTLFHKAIDNCKPMVITQRVKRGGATYQVPYPVQAKRGEWFAMRWLSDAIKERPKPRKTHYHEELAREIVDAANGRGKVVKKKDDIHKLAQANKAYAHYRWG